MRALTKNHLVTWAVLLASLGVAFACAHTSWVRLAENELRAGVAQLVQKEASGQVHIVEIDAKSIDSVRQWPWPRDKHARLVRELSAAGARSIVFDIDFSSRSTPENDAAFASAIASSNSAVVMPTFSQGASENSEARVDALPIPELRRNTSLASASVKPDTDARVRQMVFGTMTDGTPRPSMSAQIAGADGAIDSFFAIDFSIQPVSIPRHSFIDVENGQFDKASVAGKDVLVGATAIELGDRYGVPTYGVIPGVTIQALAAETLLAGGLGEWGWMPLFLVGGLLAFLVVRASSYVGIASKAAGALAIILVIDTVAYHAFIVIVEAVPGMLAILFAALAQTARVARAQLIERSLIDSETGYPNAMAFTARQHPDEQFIATAYIKDFDSIQAVLGKAQIGKLVERIVDRLAPVHELGEVFRADTRAIAWVHNGDVQALSGAFEAFEEAMKKPVQVGETRVDVALTFGIASGANLADASRAASHAAKEGKLWHAHEDAEAALVEQRVSLMGELDEAIDAGDLKVVYQPKLRFATGRIESVEALVRWVHPVRGFMGPDVFIPLAEETNRIEPMTVFVLKQTLADMAELSRRGIDISAAVNISANLISSELFVREVERIISASRIPRDRIILEVTESATMKDPDLAAANLQRFRDLGVLISMDDYGTGQSTLSYLQKLPLSELKIDRAFVQNCHKDRSDALLVRSTIQLAHSLGLRVVCEGVEEEECLHFLRENGCDYAQGYFISKPVSRGELAERLLEDVMPEMPLAKAG